MHEFRKRTSSMNKIDLNGRTAIVTG